MLNSSLVVLIISKLRLFSSFLLLWQFDIRMDTTHFKHWLILLQQIVEGWSFMLRLLMKTVLVFVIKSFKLHTLCFPIEHVRLRYYSWKHSNKLLDSVIGVHITFCFVHVEQFYIDIRLCFWKSPTLTAQELNLRECPFLW